MYLFAIILKMYSKDVFLSHSRNTLGLKKKRFYKTQKSSSFDKVETKD